MCDALGPEAPVTTTTFPLREKRSLRDSACGTGIMTGDRVRELVGQEVRRTGESWTRRRGRLTLDWRRSDFHLKSLAVLPAADLMHSLQ